MLLSSLRFEWRYQTRQVAFAAAAFLFFALGVALVASGYGPPSVNVNSPFVAMLATGLLSLPAVFLATVFCTAAVLRDTEHQMAEIVFATQVGKTRYLLGRFGGSMLVAGAAQALAALGMAIAPLIVVIQPERLGPLDWISPLRAFFILGLPNLVLLGAIVFAVAALTRSALASYVSAVFLYAGYFLCAYLLASPLMAGAAPASAESLARAALLDPFGISAVFDQARTWTPAERNTRPITLAGSLLANRLLWLGVAGAILALTHHFASLRVASRARRAPALAPDTDSPTGALYHPVPTGRMRAWSVFRAEAAVQTKYVLASRPFLALLALWVLVTWGNFSGGEAAEYGSRLYPTTGLLLATAAQMLAQLGTVILVYFSAELVWRERSLRFAEIVDATPAPSVAFYLARLAALAAAVAALALTAGLVAVAMQMVRGYPRLEPALHLRFLLTAGVPLVLFAVAALLAQAVSPNRYVGMFLAAAVAFVMVQGEALGLHHPLLRFAGAPGVPHSDLAGSGQAGATALWLLLYWGLFAALLGFVTVGVWGRGTASTPWTRMRALPARLGRRGIAGALACAALVLGTGAFIFYNANVLNEYESAEDADRWRAGYERAYRAAAGGPQPHVVAVRSWVDLYPEDRKLATRGILRLRNGTGRPLRTVWVSVGSDVDDLRLAVGNADAAVRDERFGMYGFRLRRALAPGEEVELAYAWSTAQRGLRADGFDRAVADNGSMVRHQAAFPMLGYRASFELDDPAARREHGLPPRPPAPAAGEDGEEETLGRATFETVVSTSGDQVAVAPGELVESWKRNGRSHFRYATGRPVVPRFGFVSARYEVRRVRHAGVSVEVYFHPGHATNVDAMLRAATVSLDVFGRAFGPYPARSLRIVEVPGYWGFGAYALPGMIYFPENRGFLTDARDPGRIDLVARRVAHEVAHQWWGHQVNAGARPGASTLTESLAKYAEQLVIRRMHGEEHVARIVETDLGRYVQGRGQERDPEPPLSRVAGQAHLYYGRGAVVMNGLRDLVGEAGMNRALRRIVNEHGRAATSPDVHTLVRHLQAEAAPADRPLVSEWLESVVTYDLRVDSARSRPIGAGRHEVVAHVTASKRRGDAEVPMDERLGVAVGTSVTKHRIRSGRNEIRMIVAGPPGEVRIDPFVTRVELERRDN